MVLVVIATVPLVEAGKNIFDKNMEVEYERGVYREGGYEEGSGQRDEEEDGTKGEYTKVEEDVEKRRCL